VWLIKTDVHYECYANGDIPYIIILRILFRTRNVPDKSCGENQALNFVMNNCIFFENHTVYQIIWKKNGTAGQATDGNIIWRMCFACWINKATNTHSQYVTLIALEVPQWLHEHASVLRYTYIACLIMLVTS
jgi:hypothetical protein